MVRCMPWRDLTRGPIIQRLIAFSVDIKQDHPDRVRVSNGETEMKRRCYSWVLSWSQFNSKWGSTREALALRPCQFFYRWRAEGGYITTQFYSCLHLLWGSKIRQKIYAKSLAYIFTFHQLWSIVLTFEKYFSKLISSIFLFDWCVVVGLSILCLNVFVLALVWICL